MTVYEKTFKEEAVKLSDEIGLAKASEQLGVFHMTPCHAGGRNAKNSMIKRTQEAGIIE